jgi:hypothetical protein
MNRLTLYITILLLIISTAYSQDFINDLYISHSNQNNNTSTIHFENELNSIEETYEYNTLDSLYDDNMDYETRINKFHNPHYQFYYTWDYGWGSPYWHTPYWSFGYNHYGWSPSLNYGLSWSWGNSWHHPHLNYWHYSWDSPYYYSNWIHGGYWNNWNNHYAYNHLLYSDYYGINYNTTNYSYGHRNTKNTNIPSKSNNIQRGYKDNLNSDFELKDRINRRPTTTQNKNTTNPRKEKKGQDIQNNSWKPNRNNNSNKNNSWKPNRNNNSNRNNSWQPSRNSSPSKSNTRSKRN